MGPPIYNICIPCPALMKWVKERLKRKKATPFPANSPLPYCKTAHRAPPNPPCLVHRRPIPQKMTPVLYLTSSEYRPFFSNHAQAYFSNLGWEGWENFSLTQHSPSAQSYDRKRNDTMVKMHMPRQSIARHANWLNGNKRIAPDRPSPLPDNNKIRAMPLLPGD